MNKVKNERVVKVALIVGVITAILLVMTIFIGISMYFSRNFNNEEVEVGSSGSTEMADSDNKRGISSVVDNSLTSNKIISNSKHIEQKVRESPVQESKNKEVKVQQEGWTTENLNVRKSPNTDADILDILPFNTYIKYCEYNNKWAEIAFDNGQGYVSLNYISDEKCNYITYNIPKYQGFKSWMSYKAITNKSSKQYKLQKIATTGFAGIRTYNNRFCVAVGTAFNADIGTYIDLILEDGFVIPCIIADIKNPKHTDYSNIFTTVRKNKKTYCCSEFVVDTGSLNADAARMGDMSYVNDNWKGRVKKIYVYDKNVFKEEE